MEEKEKEEIRLRLIKEKSLKKIKQLKNKRKIREEEMKIKKEER